MIHIAQAKNNIENAYFLFALFAGPRHGYDTVYEVLFRKRDAYAKTTILPWWSREWSS